MIVTFDKYKLITENPDTIWIGDDRYYCGDREARPFFMTVNQDHTKVKNLYLGDYGCYHGSIWYDGSRHKRAYPGRIWVKSKLMTFWVYPNEKLFVSIIENLEKEANIKMFNNGWKIEIIKNFGDGTFKKKEFNPNIVDDYYSDSPYGKSEIIPIEEYAGSENVPEEIQIMHLMTWQEKEFAKAAGKLHFGKWGSYKTGWDQPHNIKYRQTIYQEKKKY